MAGEWIAYDLALPAKPEVQELIDETGQPVEVVVYRLLQLWGWASMHCTDGTARMTLARLVRTCGGDEAFWLAVAAVGWLEIDQTAATVAVPGWDRRFSQAAKSRAQHRERAVDQRDRIRRAPDECAQAHSRSAPERTRGEERRISSSSARGCAVGAEASQDGWLRLKAAWNAGPGRPWTPPEPADGALDRLSEPGWLQQAADAIGRLEGCQYFATPVTLPQFCRPGFVQRVLGGQYDAPKTPKQLPVAADGRRSAAEAAKEWKRRAADPERLRMRQEFLDAKRRRAAPSGDDEIDAMRQSLAAAITAEEQP